MTVIQQLHTVRKWIQSQSQSTPERTVNIDTLHLARSLSASSHRKTQSVTECLPVCAQSSTLPFSVSLIHFIFKLCLCVYLVRKYGIASNVVNTTRKQMCGYTHYLQESPKTLYRACQETTHTSKTSILPHHLLPHRPPSLF